MAQYISINTAQNVTIDYEVANLGDRILAFLIDGLIKGAYVFLAFLMIVPQLADSNWRFGLILGGFLAIPMVFYSLIFEIFNNGQTPGKKAMDIKVVAMDGEEVSTGMYFLRWLFRIIDINIMSGIIAILTIAFTEKGQRVGDLVGDTTVISLKKKKKLSDTVYETLDLDYIPKYPTVQKLSSKDISTIKEVLRNKADDSFSLKIHLSRKLEEVLDVKKEGSSEDFLKDVVLDYNHYQQVEEY